MESSPERMNLPRLNAGLCPAEFEICVPLRCRLLGDLSSDTEWTTYLDDLDPKRDKSQDFTCCLTCDLEPGRLLHGQLAIAHACRVHDRIHRPALTLEQVTAVDVGFAVAERQTQFEDLLAIRIHVNQKRTPEQLIRAGLSNFTTTHVMKRVRDARNAGGKDGSPFHGAPESFMSMYKAYQTLSVDDPADKPAETPDGHQPPPPNPKTCSDEEPDCYRMLRWMNVLEILESELDGKRKVLAKNAKLAQRYPIGGVGEEDLSIFCPKSIEETISLSDIRLCICGVPIDIINAQYQLSAIHPADEGERGVFVEPLQRSDELNDREHMLIGRDRVNPLAGGISVGSITGQAGTLGAIVWDRTDGTPCVLSNWHVLAGTTTAQVGQPTYQPALFDGGTEEDVVAYLKRWRLGEEGDAAIAELSGDRNYASGETLGMWHPISGYLKPELNMQVRKWGRTTGFTKGFIDGIHLATNIDYGGGVTRYFRSQFHIAPARAGENVSQVGDSGSLVLTSVQPLRLRDDLTKTIAWLRACCDSKEADTLCAEIGKTLTRFQQQCGKHSDICKPVCTVLDGIQPAQFCQKPPNLGALKKHLEAAKKCLVAACKGLRLRLVAVKESKKGLEKLYEEFCCRDNCARFSNAEIEGLQCLVSELSPFTGNDAVHKQLARCPDQATFCEILILLLDLLTQEMERLTNCVAFTAAFEKALAGWLKRCARILDGQLICQTLCHNSCCTDYDLACQNHSQWVMCIAEAIAEARAENAAPSTKSSSSQLNMEPEQFEEVLNRAKLSRQTLRALVQHHESKEQDDLARNTTRTYFAVGMIFAGDTPGSPFGEFAIASDISDLARELQFSLRPVFEPRSSFRELRELSRQSATDRALQSRQGIGPGGQRADSRGGGPQPDPEPLQSGSGSGSGGGSG